MEDLAFDNYLSQMSNLIRTAAEIGVELDELIAHLSSAHSEGTSNT